MHRRSQLAFLLLLGASALAMTPEHVGPSSLRDAGGHRGAGAERRARFALRSQPDAQQLAEQLARAIGAEVRTQ